MPDRLDELTGWLHRVLGHDDIQLAPASEDASFRRYFRATVGARHWIVMDAPPDREDVRPFVAIARLLRTAGVNAPRIIAADETNGFLLLTDLGSQLYLDALGDPSRAPDLYEDAIDTLVAMQQTGQRDGWQLPAYDRALLLREMGLFRDWLIGRHLELDVCGHTLGRVFEWLSDSALAQPVVFVHRDFHSRNLMACGGSNPGVLDFQDAVLGPVSYDLVSLLRDCYVAWSCEQVDGWIGVYRQRAMTAGLPVGDSEAQFRRWFDLMGVQRHLKAAGIFARLWHRDGKPGYLGDVPRTLGYVSAVAKNYPELAELSSLVDDTVLPALARAGMPCAP